EGFEAVFIGSGAGLPKFMGIQTLSVPTLIRLLWKDYLHAFTTEQKWTSRSNIHKFTKSGCIVHSLFI
ncbi:hypothetical protein CLONEX_01602, partial [[Clostridium] nexile DSM 1787]